MLDWMKKRRPAYEEPERVAARDQRPVMFGKYLSFYTYLDKRYADAVVLTFAEIESLLGFSLPDVARLSEGWWTIPDPDAARPRFSDSWILANRSARPNLPARTVAFDRVF